MIKDLLKENIIELRKNTHLNVSTINFKGDEFIVLDKDKKIILKDKILNYDVDFESQKKFILDVIKNISSFIVIPDIIDFISCSDIFMKIDYRYYSNVLGDGDILKNAEYIRVNYDIDNHDEYNYFIDDVINMIKEKLDENKIRVVAYSDSYQEGFYVDGVIEMYDTCLYYIEDNYKEYSVIDLYYSNATKKEIEEAVKFIKDLVA